MIDLWPLRSRRCTGHCCRAFTFGDSRSVEEALTCRYDSTANQLLDFPDGDKLLDMLVSLGRDIENYPDDTKAVIPNLERELNRPMTQRDCRFTCRHIKDNQCTNYADRPEMCKEFPRYEPYSFLGACTHNGCTHRYNIFKACWIWTKRLPMRYRNWKFVRSCRSAIQKKYPHGASLGLLTALSPEDTK